VASFVVPVFVVAVFVALVQPSFSVPSLNCSESNFALAFLVLRAKRIGRVATQFALFTHAARSSNNSTQNFAQIFPLPQILQNQHLQMCIKTNNFKRDYISHSRLVYNANAMVFPKTYRTNAGWAVTIGCLIAIIAGKGALVRGAIIWIVIIGALGFTWSAIEHGWIRGSHKLLSSFILLLPWVVMAGFGWWSWPPNPYYTLSYWEQRKFLSAIKNQKEPKEMLVVSCPASDENYA